MKACSVTEEPYHLYFSGICLCYVIAIFLYFEQNIIKDTLQIGSQSRNKHHLPVADRIKRAVYIGAKISLLALIRSTYEKKSL